MTKKYELIFDKVIIKQLKKESKNQRIKQILTDMFDRLELIGPTAGKLLDPKLHIYEVKSKKPPIRMYFKYKQDTKEIYVFEYQIKTSEDKQDKKLGQIKKKAMDLES